MRGRVMSLYAMMFMGMAPIGALVAGYFALTLLVKLVKRGDFSRFCYYVWFMAIVAALST